MSLSTVKRRLRTIGLYRRKQGAPSLSNEDLKKAIEIELGGSGCFVGYRKMWARLKQKGIFVKRERVMHILRSLDPVGVEYRKRKRLRRRAYRTKGPNSVWHIDGHDKLKPFGFSIHACIDGFSRRLIWLEVGPTNKDPEVIAKMYLDAVKQIIGLPRKIRSDDGTENCLVEPIHTYLRSSSGDPAGALESFAIGRSTSKQRIEAYWSHLVKDGPGWWINFFKDLRDLGNFDDSDPAHVECIRFCFMHIIRKELDQAAELWNQHIISSSKFGNSSGPRGKPDCMYFLPHLYQTKDYKLEVELEEVEEFIDNATMCPPDFSQESEEFASVVMGELGLEMPNNVKEGLDLYLQLIKEINKY